MPDEAAMRVRDTQILSLGPIVKRCAQRAARLTSRISKDDLTSIAWLAAISAVDDYDAKRGPLESFAKLRISSKLKNEINRRGLFERQHVQVTEINNEPINLDDYRRDDSPQSGAHHNNPAEIVVEADIAERVHHAVIQLEPRRRNVILEHYGADRPLFRVAATMKISTQRAYQLEHDALRKIRQTFGKPA